MKIPEHLTIKRLRELYKEGKVTPLSVIDEILNRVEDHERYNIWIEKPQMEKIQTYLEKLKVEDFDKKPLWGIPFAVKDNIDLAGFPTTAACPNYAYKPRESAAVVKRLINAGAIPLGKTNMDQFATGLVGTRSPYGEVHNSLNEDLISGGSSAGSAVSVALGEAAFALGTDTAGSGRVPAALNGLTGWKPAVGAWSNKGVVPACASLDCVTVFANNISDSDEVDKVARGYEESDPWSKKRERKADALPCKIVFPDSEIDFYGLYGDGYKKAWENAEKIIKDISIENDIKAVYEDTDFYQEAAGLLYGGPCVSERWADLGEFVSANPESVFPVTKTVLESGNRPDYSAELLFKTQHKLRQYQRRSEILLDDGILVLPTCAGTYTREEVRQNPISTNSDMGRYTNHCNLLDMCAIAVPIGTTEQGLPFGVTLFALAENEHLIFGMAELLERKTGKTDKS